MGKAQRDLRELSAASLFDPESRSYSDGSPQRKTLSQTQALHIHSRQERLPEKRSACTCRALRDCSRQTRDLPKRHSQSLYVGGCDPSNTAFLRSQRQEFPALRRIGSFPLGREIFHESLQAAKGQSL